jgi:hypothetical protein
MVVAIPNYVVEVPRAGQSAQVVGRFEDGDIQTFFRKAMSQRQTEQTPADNGTALRRGC